MSLFIFMVTKRVVRESGIGSYHSPAPRRREIGQMSRRTSRSAKQQDDLSLLGSNRSFIGIC